MNATQIAPAVFRNLRGSLVILGEFSGHQERYAALIRSLGEHPAMRGHLTTGRMHFGSGRNGITMICDECGGGATGCTCADAMNVRYGDCMNAAFADPSLRPLFDEQGFEVQP